MSRRRRWLPPPPPEPDEDCEEPELELEPDEEVEYFVEVEEEDCWRTSVPNSAHSAQTSSSAPSILTVLG
jgi:hypothetical protein